MVQKYGLKMEGLEDASAATADWPENSGFVSIIRYDPEDGKVWVSEATGDQLAGKYDIFRTRRHVSAQRIADEIAEHVRLSQLTPQARYALKNTVQISLKLNRQTDADILDFLSKQDNRQGCIKEALREKMKSDNF